MNFPIRIGMIFSIRRRKYNAKCIYGKDKTIYILLGISAAVSVVLFILAFLSLVGTIHILEDAITGVDLIVMAILSIIGPIGFYNYVQAKKKREIEQQLPDFLREISSSTSSGMTVFDAIQAAAKGDHGRLTGELQQMASQLSWGISIKDALNNFAKRINTDAIKRMVVTVTKALEIGGNTSSVFEAAAKEIDQTKKVDLQRRMEMSMYSIVIFISFFVFLAVILIIDKTIFAALFDLQGKVPGGSLGGTGLSIAPVDQNLLKNTLFSFVFVQSIGGGLLGGFMMDGRLSSGVRFGFVLVLISFVTFKFFF